jgi:hypothetical protein
MSSPNVRPWVFSAVDRARRRGVHVPVVGGSDARDARPAGFDSVTVGVTVDDHKRFSPGATALAVRHTADRRTGQFLGGQLVGTDGIEVSKRVEVLAAAMHAGLRIRELGDFDLAYTPPLSAPWGALRQAAHAWIGHATAAHSEVQKEAGL